MGGLALDLFCVLVGQIINIVYNHLDIDKVKIRCVRQNKCYTFIRGKRHTKWLHLYSFGRSVEKLNVCVIILNWAFIPLQILHYLNSFFFFGNCTLLASYKFAAGHTHFLFVAKMQSVHHHVANDSGFPTPLPQSLGVPALSSDPGEEWGWNSGCRPCRN